MKEKFKTFSDKLKVRELVTNRSVLPEIQAKMVFQAKMKEHGL